MCTDTETWSDGANTTPDWPAWLAREKRLSMNTITPNEIRRTTRKRGNCECIATWGSPTPRMQSLYALISIHMSSLNSLSLSVCRLRAFYCLYVTLRCDLELWPRDLDLWPLILNMYSRRASLRSNCVPNFERNWTIRGRVIAIWIFDLMTLNTYRVLRYALE